MRIVSQRVNPVHDQARADDAAEVSWCCEIESDLRAAEPAPPIRDAAIDSTPDLNTDVEAIELLGGHEWYWLWRTMSGPCRADGTA